MVGGHHGGWGHHALMKSTQDNSIFTYSLFFIYLHTCTLAGPHISTEKLSVCKSIPPSLCENQGY